jgi:hypothetical protein
MAGEREQILHLVAAGELTVEQAMELLHAVEESHLVGSAAPQARESGLMGLHEQLKALEPMLSNLVSVAPRIAEARHRAGFADVWYTPVAPVAPVPPTPPTARTYRVRRPRARTEDRVGSPFNFEQLIQLSMHGIEPSFVKEIREAGLEDLTLDEAVQLGVHDIKPAFVRAMREEFGDSLRFEDLVQLAIHGVEPSYVREVRAAGLDELTVEQVVQMSIHGIDVKTVRGWKEAGLTNVSIEDEVEEVPEPVDQLDPVDEDESDDE